MPSVQMVFNLKCLMRRDEEASVVVSHCPALGVYSQGENEDEAREAIKSAVILYIQAAYDCDRLGRAGEGVGRGHRAINASDD